MTTPTATAAPTSTPQTEAFNALGQTTGMPAAPMLEPAGSFDMGLDQASILNTFFSDDPSNAPPALNPGAKADPAVAPAAGSETAGKGAAVEPAAAAPSSGTAPTTISSQPQTPAPVGGPAVPGVSSPSAPAPTAAELEKDLRIQAMEAELTRFRSAATAPAPSSAPPAVQAMGPELTPPAYNLDIPDQLVTAMFSEDPATAKQGIAALVNSLAQIVHANVQKEFKGYVPAVLQQYETRQQEAAQVAELNKDYYGAFPTHNVPAIAQMVAQEATTLQQQTGATTWSSAMRDAVGARVNARIAAAQAAGIPIPGFTPGTSAPAPQPLPAVTPVPTTPAPFAPVSTREGSAVSDDAAGFMARTIRG